MQIHYETGQVTEIGASEFNKNETTYSHVLIENAEGEKIRLRNLRVLSSLDTALAVGTEGTFAFVKRTGLTSGQSTTGLIAIGNADGLSVVHDPDFTPMKRKAGIILFLAVGALFIHHMLALAILMFVALPTFVGYGIAAISLRKQKKMVDGVRAQFLTMGIQEKALRVY